MINQGLTGRHKRLIEYLTTVCKLKSEQFNFADTYGQASANFNETQFATVSFAPDQPEDTVDPVPKVFDLLPTELETRMAHEYVLHLVIKDFAGDIGLLLSQLLFWLAQEKQDIKLDYKLSWNNDSSVDLNIYLDIAERTKITEKQGTKTC